MINQDIMHGFQIASWVTLSVGGLIAAFKAIYEVRQNREQRKKELRWRRANVAKEILDEMFSHHLAQNAGLMLDWSEHQRNYEIKEGDRQTVSYSEVLSALGKKQKAVLDDKQVFIVDSFDYFFYFIDRIEHHIRIKLISFEDVAAPLKRYSEKIENHRELYESFMRFHGYYLAIQFFKRFAAVPAAA